MLFSCPASFGRHLDLGTQHYGLELPRPGRPVTFARSRGVARARGDGRGTQAPDAKFLTLGDGFRAVGFTAFVSSRERRLSPAGRALLEERSKGLGEEKRIEEERRLIDDEEAATALRLDPTIPQSRRSLNGASDRVSDRVRLEFSQSVIDDLRGGRRLEGRRRESRVAARVRLPFELELEASLAYVRSDWRDEGGRQQSDDGLGDHVRRVADRDPPPRSGRDVDAVVADPESRHDPQPGRRGEEGIIDHHVVDHEQSLGRRDCREELVAPAAAIDPDDLAGLGEELLVLVSDPHPNTRDGAGFVIFHARMVVRSGWRGPWFER